MTRLTQYLFEKVDHDKINYDESGYYDDIANQIKKDSKQWLKASGGLPGVRASRKPATSYFVKRNIRSDRRPLTTDEKTHELMDDLFKKHHGWRARSEVLFTQGGEHTGYFYGHEKFAVFPIGKFKYLWNPKIRDLGPWAHQVKNKSVGKAMDTGKSRVEIVIDELEGIVKKYKNTGLKEVMTKYPHNEIMVSAKEYYMIPYDLYKTEIEWRLDKP